MKRRLFVDMDGTLAEFKPAKKLEDLYEEGYFLNLRPFEEVVDAIKMIHDEDNDVEVFVLSAYLSDSQYALTEKNKWLDKYMPFIDQEHRCFCFCGSDKKEAVPDGIRIDDFLLDDYTKNLNDWEPPAIAIKLINGINDTHKSWQGQRITRFQEPKNIKGGIVDFISTIPSVNDDIDNDTCEINE